MKTPELQTSAKGQSLDTVGRTVEFRFDIRDKVLVRDISQVGQIDALLLDSDGGQYRVIYWVNGERKQQWLYEWEIQARECA